MEVKRKYKNVATLVRRYRRMRDISQGQLSLRLGIHIQQISNIERGLNSLPKKNIHGLAKIFNIQSEHIVDEMIEDEREFLMETITQQRLIDNEKALATSLNIKL